MKPRAGLNHTHTEQSWGGCSCWQPSSPPLSAHKSPKICCNTGRHRSFCSHLKESYCSDSPISLFQEQEKMLDTAKSSLSGQMIFFQEARMQWDNNISFSEAFSQGELPAAPSQALLSSHRGKGMAQAPSQQGLTLESSSKLMAEQKTPILTQKQQQE